MTPSPKSLSAAASRAVKRRRLSSSPPDHHHPQTLASASSSVRSVKSQEDDDEVIVVKDEAASTPPLPKRSRLTPMRTVPASSPATKKRHSQVIKSDDTCKPELELYERPGSGWADWPAPRGMMADAREWVKDTATKGKKVLLLPDKDADGLTGESTLFWQPGRYIDVTLVLLAGYVMHKTIELLGLPATNIFVHVLSKGTNVHSPSEREVIESLVEREGIERVVVLDQGSRPGSIIANLPPHSPSSGDDQKPMLLIDHHQSAEVSPKDP